MRLYHATCTATGRGRTLNEDASLLDGGRGLFVVADGRGPLGTGPQAAKMVCDQLRVEIPSGVRQQDAHTLVERGLFSANRAIRRETQRHAEKEGMAATAVVALFDGPRVTIGHVGNCRAYIHREDRVQAATTDHTLLMEQIREGLISAAEAQHSPERQVVLRTLGADENVTPDISTFDLRDGDVVVLCSDGITEWLDDTALARTVERFGEDVQGACSLLVNMSGELGGPDDATVVMIRVVMEREPAVAGTGQSRVARGGFPVLLTLALLLLLVSGSLGLFWLSRAPAPSTGARAVSREASPPPDASARDAQAGLIKPAPPSAPELDQLLGPQPTHTNTPSTTPTASNTPTYTHTPAMYAQVREIVAQLEETTQQLPEKRVTFLRTQTTDGWGIQFIDEDRPRHPFTAEVTRINARQHLWRGRRGADYLLDVHTKTDVVTHLARITLEDFGWTVQIAVAEPTRTPTHTHTPSPTPSATPTPPALPILDIPPEEDFHHSEDGEHRQMAERALRQFIEVYLAQALRLSSMDDMKPALNQFSSEVAAAQYGFHTGDAMRGRSLRSILERYVASPHPPRLRFMGLSGERGTVAKSRVLFSVQYQTSRQGQWPVTYDLHDVDIERVGGNFRIVRIYRYEQALPNAPRLDGPSP